MIIDDLYQTVQETLKKQQNGYIKPMAYNLFLRKAQYQITNKLFADLKSNVRKQNWHLDGKNFANYSENIRQLLEHFSIENNNFERPYLLPSNLSIVSDVFIGNTRIDKVSYSDFKDLQGNIYAKPSNCSPICSKVGENLKVSPSNINKVSLHYIRQPKIPKWTYVEFQGKPVFNQSANDFQDIDLPENFYNEILEQVLEQASISIRDLQVTQLSNQNQSEEVQIENKE